MLHKTWIVILIFFILNMFMYVEQNVDFCPTQPDLYLIDVFTLDSVARVASWTFATFPGAIRKTAALCSSEAGIGQTTI